MKKTIIILSAIIIILLNVRLNEMVNLSNDEINVRKKPYPTGTKISTIKPGEEVQVLKTYNDWIKISHNNNEAYTYRLLLTTKSIKLITFNLNIPLKLPYKYTPHLLLTDDIKIKEISLPKNQLQQLFLSLIIINLILIVFSKSKLKKKKVQNKKHKYSEPIIKTIYVEKPAEVKTVYVEKALTQQEKNWQAGNKFENYIIDKLSSNYNILLHRNCDTITENGNYAKNMLHPDLKFENKNTGIVYTIECKYSKFDNVKLDDHKLKRYKKHGAINKQKVFIALGTEGTPNKPKNLYIIPTYKIKNNKQLHKIKENYRKKDLTKKLSFNERFLTVV